MMDICAFVVLLLSSSMSNFDYILLYFLFDDFEFSEVFQVDLS